MIRSGTADVGSLPGTPVALRGARWPALVCGCCLLLVAGNIYAFGVWSEALSYRWPPAQREHAQSLLSTLYECMLIGTYVPISGFFFQKYGTLKTLMVGAALNTFAYLTILSQFFRDSLYAPDLLSYVAFFMVGHATSFIDIAIIGSNVRNFSLRNRGTAMGILKGYFGLSGGLLAILHETGLTTRQFLSVVGPVGSFIVMACMPWVYSSTSLMEHEPAALWKLNYILTVEVTIALLLFFFSVTMPGSSSTAATILLVLVLLIFSLSFMPQRALSLSRKLKNHHGAETMQDNPSIESVSDDISQFSYQRTSPAPSLSQTEHENETSELLRVEASSSTCETSSLQLDANDQRILDSNDDAYHMSVSEAIQSGRFWLLFWMLLILMGSGLFIVGNAARIIKSKGGDDNQVSALVSVISVSNCLGRVGIGYLADHPVLDRFNIDRTQLLSANLLIMALAQVLFAILPLRALPLAAILGGMSYGASWTLDPTILADICGVEYFGMLYALVGFAPTFGSIIFSNILSTYVYEHHATENPVTHQDECFGNQCFGLAHWITAAACFIAACTAGPLLTRLHSRAKAARLN
mmetsp:Transcript_10309/g.20263  ORF Transcript_10309/g.20263 Transcript_10309/m.20263 type:complete len:582 (-) Transcript_10309:51-1796(-)